MIEYDTQPGTGDNFRMCNLFALSAGETPKKMRHWPCCSIRTVANKIISYISLIEHLFLKLND